MATAVRINGGLAAPIPAQKTQSGDRMDDGSQSARDVRFSNIMAAKGVAEAVRTSLGPRGMDKMVVCGGEVLITNDGATILEKMRVEHPAAKMLVQLSKSQDIVAGDGTTTVVVICGALLDAALTLLNAGIHPTTISEAFGVALNKALDIVEHVATPVDLSNREMLAQIAATSLGSKVVGEYASVLAPVAVEAVLRVSNGKMTRTSGGDSGADPFVDLDDIRIVKKLGGTIDDTALMDGVILKQGVSGNVEKVSNAKIGLIQFCLSPPKTDIENSVIVKDYTAMDRILREERAYILGLVKKIKAAGCNVLLIQKSILRDATTDLSMHYLNKLKIMVVTDVERDEIRFLSKALDLTPIADISAFSSDKLARADLVALMDDCVAVTGIQRKTSKATTSLSGTDNSVPYTRTASIVIRGSNQLVLDEAERSLHDALCVVRSLVQKRFLLSGGGAIETEIAVVLSREAKALKGLQAYCLAEYARALEVVPFTLAENAGMSPIHVVSELRKRHLAGEKDAGVVLRKGGVGNVREEKVEMPLLVMTSALKLATECVRMVLKIDDIVLTA